MHLQDITRVHDGKSDMRDGLVNWSKMRQIAKYASAVAHCGRPTPHYPHDERLSKLVMDAPVFSLDDDDDVSNLLIQTLFPILTASFAEFV